MKRLLAYILAMCSVFAAFTRNPVDSVKVYFRLGNSRFDPAFRDNREAMSGFISNVSNALEEDLIERIVVRAYSSPDGASDANVRLSQRRCKTIAEYIVEKTGVNRDIIQEEPEGVGWNELRNLVDTTPDVPYREKILHILDNTPLWVFDSHGNVIDGRKKQLMDLAGGRPFNWMLTNLFPDIRNAIAIAIFLRSDPTNTTDITDITNTTDITETTDITDITKPTDITDIIHPTDITKTTDITDITHPTDITKTTDITNPTDITDITDITNPTDITDITDQTKLVTDTIRTELLRSETNLSEEINLTDKPDQSGEPELPDISGKPDFTDFPKQIVSTSSNRYFALKTNMLYDAAVVPNISLELYTGKNTSIYGEWMYSWWAKNSLHRYWRVYGGNLGARWWFGHKAKRKPLTGHHLGIFGGIVTFDFEWGNTGYMGGKPGGTLWDRCLINSGIEYGYSLPIGRHLNIDFSIAAGYLGGKYIKYFPFDNEYFREKEYRLRFFGPTKAEISLVWLLGHGNINRKGGEE